MRDLAVVIVSWNVRELLGTCLRSLLEDLEGSSLDALIQVIDNASTDGTPEAVAKRFPQVELVVNRENLGFAAANNVALGKLSSPNASTPRYVWLLNPDTEVRPGATRALLGCLDARPRAGVAGARLVYADGRLQHSAFRFPGLIQLAFELFHLPPRLYETPLNGRYPTWMYGRQTPFRVDHPLGASMMVRTDAVAQVGLLDERYRMYCEEIDWCWRMRRVGWLAYCVPGAEVVHHGGQSSGQVPVTSFVNLWKSRSRLYRRFHGPVSIWAARQMVRLGMARRMQSATPEMRAACQEVLLAWSSP